MVTDGYCLLGLLLLVPTFSMNARNAGSHRNDRKFHKSQQILNQIKRNINKLCLGKISCQKAVRINFTWILHFRKHIANNENQEMLESTESFLN